jgi:hypothetical protein
MRKLLDCEQSWIRDCKTAAAEQFDKRNVRAGFKRMIATQQPPRQKRGEP